MELYQDSKAPQDPINEKIEQVSSLAATLVHHQEVFYDKLTELTDSVVKLSESVKFLMRHHHEMSHNQTRSSEDKKESNTSEKDQKNVTQKNEESNNQGSRSEGEAEVLQQLHDLEI